MVAIGINGWAARNAFLNSHYAVIRLQERVDQQDEEITRLRESLARQLQIEARAFANNKKAIWSGK